MIYNNNILLYARSRSFLSFADIDTYGSFHFVCDHGKHRNAKRYNFGCNFVVPPLPVPKVTSNIAPFSKTYLTT